MSFFKKFGSHYAIERFGVMFLSLVICMGVLVGTIATKQVRYNHQKLTGQALYSSSFTMSLSGTSGSVTGLYVDEDHTKAMILLKFSDMSLMSTNVDDYSLSICGSTKSGYYENIKSSPSGMIYLFGTSGYMVVYLQDISGFPSQILALQISSSNTVTGEAGTDYCIIYFNPGGSWATTADFLSTNDWTIFDMVEEVITRNDEVALRSTLREELLSMAKQQVIIDAYVERLESLDVIVPDTPFAIDDTIYGLSSESSEKLHYITSYGGGWVTEDESTGYRSDDVTYYLDSSYTLMNGFDFTWQTGRILTGYLEQLTGTSDSSAWAEYLEITEETDTAFATELEAMTWKMRDGSEIDLEDEESDIVTNINLLIDAWQTYYDLKTEYECTNLYSLLELEYTARTSFDTYTVNSDSSVLTIK